MRAAVTGASGFVGGWLRSHLEAMGDHVVAVDTDVTQAAELRADLVAAAPEVIYHLAGQANVAASWTDPAATFLVNANGTLHVLDVARTMLPMPRVLVVGSADEYGIVDAEDMPIREDQPLRPVSPYAASKVAAEYLARQAHSGFGVPTVCVRSFNHIGPGQSDGFVVSSLARQVADAERTNTEVLRVGNLSARRDFTDVRDVVRAYRLLMQHGEPGGVYNVCSGTDVAIADLADALVASSRVPLRIEVDPARVRPVDTPVFVGDSSLLRSTTGWAPQFDVRTTVTEVLDWWRASGPPKGSPE
jgi:GDP-4-dehydro-6-deoxy-D-mannose reductase